ncbi:YetF domain-containing protein [Bacillus sp. AK128]
METPELLLRISIGFVVLFILARTMGRKEVSQVTFFNFVSAIAIGSIAANLVVNNNLSVQNGVIALVGWTIFTLAMSIINIKSKEARKFTNGEPLVVIKEGKIIENSLKKTRLDLDSLNALLRQKNVFSMADVDFAILETSGKLSVMKKEPKQFLTKSDMNIVSKKTKIFPIATELVLDGKIISQNLTKLRLNEEWLDQQLKNSGVKSVSDVFYAEVQQDGSLYVDSKTNFLH